MCSPACARVVSGRLHRCQRFGWLTTVVGDVVQTFNLNLVSAADLNFEEAFTLVCTCGRGCLHDHR